MRVISYSSMYSNERKEYTNSFAMLLLDYFKERHSDINISSLDSSLNMIDMLLSNKYMIYFVVNDNKDILGFVILSIGNQFGMTKPYVVVDYMYIVPEYRKGLVSRLLFITAGKVCTSLGMDAICQSLDGVDNNYNNIKKVGGEQIGVLFKMNMGICKTKYEKYMKGYA